MNFAAFLALFVFISLGLGSEPISKADRKRMDELLNKNKDADKNKTDTPGEPLAPDDFIRGAQAQAAVGDFNKEVADPIPDSGKFEGDIDLRDKPIDYYVDRVIDDSPYAAEGDVQRNAIRANWLKWPQARIPYQVSSRFSAYSRGIIASAIGDYNKYTCIRWVPRTSADRNYVYFFIGRGCYSSVGKTGGAQYLSLGYNCVRKGIVIHEMMHAAGFWHEQSRNDRDDYITIHWQNVQYWARGNFQKFSLSAIDHLGTAYDLSSIMHYGPRAFSRNGYSTITAKNGQRFGQRNGFSQNDIYKLNKLYGCPNSGAAKKGKVTPKPTSGICEDENFHCHNWAEEGKCDTNADFMKKNCKRSCKVCTDKTSCTDKHKWCNYWLGVGQCTNPAYTDYMKIHCPKSCNRC